MMERKRENFDLQIDFIEKYRLILRFEWTGQFSLMISLLNRNSSSHRLLLLLILLGLHFVENGAD